MTENCDHQYTVLNAHGHRVLNVGSEGEFEDGDPAGIAADGEGNVYVTSEDHKLWKFNRCGEVVKSIGKEGENVGEFNWPFNIRYHEHQVYVCDSNNGRVQVFDLNLNFVQSFGDGPDQLVDPRDIGFNTQGNSYVVDYEKDQVLVFSGNGQYLRHFGQGGQSKGELSGAAGLCVRGDYVYVTNYYSVCVSVFHTSGEFVHYFGEERSDRVQLVGPYGI